MPLTIPIRHIKRMFPYEFYDELYQAYSHKIPMTPVFTKKAMSISVENPKTEFENDYQMISAVLNAFQQAGLQDLGFGFPVLMLMPYRTTTHITEKPQAEDTTVLCVQYFDTSHEAVFTDDLTLDSCRIIPEILWDDPNLFLGFLNMTTGQFEVLKLPLFLEDKFLEPTKGETE